MSEQVELLEVSIDAMPEERFDLDFSYAQSVEYFNELYNEGRIVNNSFEDDIWIVRRLDYESLTNSLNFKLIEGSMFNNNLPKDFKKIVKCWSMELLIETKTTAVKYYSYFHRLFKLTKGFKEVYKSELLKYLEYEDITSHSKYNIINTLCNFFNYSNLAEGESYVPSLLDFKEKIPNELTVRQLPPSREVLYFSNYLDIYFNRLLEKSLNTNDLDKELFLIYPLILWWRLGTIIPMRATEFCLIKRDCLIQKNGNCYVRLPRRKLKESRKRVQLIDKILITESMFELISNYQNLTEKFGKTTTLISYRSFKDFNRPNDLKRDVNQFNRIVLDRLIEYFYKKLETYFNCPIQLENRLKPNDPRHIAFISLMMQGYTPVEIARLGGHTAVKSQYHYSGHSEYWIDCEVLKLMSKVKNISNNFSEGILSNDVKLKAINTIAPEGKKLKIGYCIDEQQRCEARKCYYCRHWFITTQEFLEKKETIKKEISNSRNRINEFANVIKNIHNQFFQDELERMSTRSIKDLKTNSQAALNEIKKIAKLYSNLEEKVSLND